MASDERDKVINQQGTESLSARTADKNLTLEAYLRNTLDDSDVFVPKANGVTLASRLDRDPKRLNPARLDENALIPRDAGRWEPSFEPDPETRKRPKRLFPSILSYLAIAIVSGGLSGGALLYFLLHYAFPNDEAPASVSTSVASGIRSGEPTSRPQLDQPSTFASIPKAGFASAAVEKDENGLADSGGGQSRPPSAEWDFGKVSESKSFPAASDTGPKESDAGTKTAAIAPIPEAAPIAPPAPAPKELREEKPAESAKPDLGAAKRDAELPKLPADQEEKMLKRASVLLGENDIAGARLILQYLANHGSGRGAFALAESYDPKKWTGRHVAGMSPDADMARTLYERAAKLGSKEAAAVLRKEKP